jgi:hypothetical protein
MNGDCIAEARRELSGMKAIAEVQRLIHELRRVKVAREKQSGQSFTISASCTSYRKGRECHLCL